MNPLVLLVQNDRTSRRHVRSARLTGPSCSYIGWISIAGTAQNITAGRKEVVDGVLSLGQIHDACVWREAARLLLLLLMGFIGCMEITDSAFGVHSIGFQLQRTLSIGIRYGLRLSQFQWKKNTIQAQQSYICPTFFRVGGMPKLLISTTFKFVYSASRYEGMGVSLHCVAGIINSRCVRVHLARLCSVQALVSPAATMDSLQTASITLQSGSRAPSASHSQTL